MALGVGLKSETRKTLENGTVKLISISLYVHPSVHPSIRSLLSTWLWDSLLGQACPWMPALMGSPLCLAGSRLEARCLHIDQHGAETHLGWVCPAWSQLGGAGGSPEGSTPSWALGMVTQALYQALDLAANKTPTVLG